MRKINYIRKCLAIALLLAFAVGVTPKLYFHNLFSNHTDYHSNYVVKGVAVSSLKFNCGIFNLEALSPFLEVAPILVYTNQPYNQQNHFQFVSDWITLNSNHTQHRGPPACLLS